MAGLVDLPNRGSFPGFRGGVSPPTGTIDFPCEPLPRAKVLDFIQFSQLLLNIKSFSLWVLVTIKQSNFIPWLAPLSNKSNVFVYTQEINLFKDLIVVHDAYVRFRRYIKFYLQ